MDLEEGAGLAVLVAAGLGIEASPMGALAASGWYSMRDVQLLLLFDVGGFEKDFFVGRCL